MKKLFIFMISVVFGLIILIIKILKLLIKLTDWV